MMTPLEHPDDERFYIENIEPLIVNVDQHGEVLIFLFRCPVTDFEVTAKVNPRAPLSTSQRAVTRSSPRLQGILQNALAPESVKRPTSLGPTAAYTVSEIEEAACDAFESVSRDFLWDGTRWTHWEANDFVLEFIEYSEQLEGIAPEQRATLQKVLRCVAQADGVVYPSEYQLLEMLLGDFRSSSERESLPSTTELRKLESRTLASAVVCLGYAVAYIDGQLSSTEEELLSLICEQLGLGILKQWELKRTAQAFCVDEQFAKVYAEGPPSNEARLEAYKFGRGLGLTITELKELEWRFLKRSGLDD